MATPLDLVEILRAEGLQVEDHRRAPAPGKFDPIGQVLHHTASKAGRPAPSLALVHDGGTGTAPGPLCNVLWGRDLVARVITDGKANHAGMGSAIVLDRLRANLPPLGDARLHAPQNDTNGNPWFIGHEIENDGLGEPWDPALVAKVCRGAAAVARAHGWSERTTVLHREWTNRKIDPNFADGTVWRLAVAGFLLPAVQLPTPPPQEDDDMPRARIIRNGQRDGELALPLPEVARRRPFTSTRAAVDAVRAGIADPWPDPPKKADGSTDDAAAVPGGGWAWNDVDPALFEALPAS